jgi:uncharacterized protein
MMAAQAHILSDAPDASRQMLTRLAAFTRTLRDNGFAIGLKESEDAARVLALDPARRPSTLRSALKALFCAQRSDWLKFDELFNAFWRARGRARVVHIGQLAKPATSAAQRQLAGPEFEPEQGSGVADQMPREGGAVAPESATRGRMQGASRAKRLAETDFRKLADAEAVAEAHVLAARLARAMRTRLSRRDRARLKGRRVDLRRTIRRNICHGGVPIELVSRKRKRRPLRLVILLDASGSMSLYTSLFIRFIHGVLDHFREAEAFLFHTRLVHISAAMRERDVTRALERLTLLGEGVGGGTRIGESLATFNRWHARSVIHSRTCVMLVSDGYDTSAPDLLGAEMKRLARRCRRIVWLNPMMGWQGYEPSARGMQAALPHVALFAPAHNLESLAALEPYLTRL